MPRRLVNPPQMHPTPGYSHLAIAEGRSIVYFAGQVALDDDLELIGPGDLHAQTVAAMRNLETAMSAVGATWDDIVRRTIYTTQPNEFEAIAQAIQSVTGDAQDPPQTIAGVTSLALPELLIEIECTAALS